MKKHSAFIFAFTIVVFSFLFFTACSSLQPAKEPVRVDRSGPQFSAGSAEAQFDKALKGITKETITVIYYPLDDVVCLQFRINYNTYSQFWNREGREMFIQALETYKQEYEQRELVRSGKTKRAYGTVNGFLTWRMSQFMSLGISRPRISLGYYFKDKTPYFAITQFSAKNEGQQLSEVGKINAALAVYFTRAQADNLAALFDREYLAAIAKTGTEYYPEEEDEY